MPVVDQVNARFLAGTPSNDPNLAGVLVHQFDGQEAMPEQWLPCPETTSWCSAFRDRFATSLINARAPYLFNNNGGLLFRMFPPSTNRIFCSYAGDGGTMTTACDPPGESESCLPGCWTSVGGGGPNWCTPSRPWQCAFRPEDLGAMLQLHMGGQGHYNEVILSTADYVRHLPFSLEAMFVLDPGDEATRHAHALFLARYGLSASDVPLLFFDRAHKRFRDVSHAR